MNGKMNIEGIKLCCLWSGAQLNMLVRFLVLLLHICAHVCSSGTNVFCQCTSDSGSDCSWLCVQGRHAGSVQASVQRRERFKNRRTFLLACCGASIGLGNVWRCAPAHSCNHAEGCDSPAVTTLMDVVCKVDD